MFDMPRRAARMMSDRYAVSARIWRSGARHLNESGSTTDDDAARRCVTAETRRNFDRIVDVNQVRYADEEV